MSHWVKAVGLLDLSAWQSPLTQRENQSGLTLREVSILDVTD